jgi:uncharacterized protein (DUF4415 family)
MKRKRQKRSGTVARIRASVEQNDEFIDDPGVYYRPLKKAVTLRLDADVLAWFRKPGRGYQTRINRALRSVMAEERRRQKA